MADQVLAVTDAKSITPTTTNTEPVNKPASDTCTAKKAKTSWRDKFHLGSNSEEPGKEKWRDASLSEEERWKGWQKAKDREQRER
jgi:hypothetical protein